MPAVFTRASIDGLRRVHRGLKADQRQTRQRAAVAAAAEVVRAVVALAPRDTNRYVRAYGMAVNELGGGVGVPPLAETKYSAFLVRLERQVRKWRSRVERYEGQNRQRERGYLQALNQLYRAEEQLRQWSPTAVVVWGRGGRSETAASSLIRAFGREFGGEGYLVDTPAGAEVVLRNREPHARIVEQRTGVWRAAVAQAQLTGTRVVSDVYRRAVRRVMAGRPARGR